MSSISIETLSLVHIGNGNFLLRGNDFIVRDNNVYVININKLGEAIGTSDENMQLWLKAISNGHVEPFILEKLYQKKRNLYEISKRIIHCYTNFDERQDSIKECMHDGLGRPYIPGSSVKGAIRTAILSTLAKKMIFERLKSEPNQRMWKKIIFGMENELLHFSEENHYRNKDLGPSSDIFRFLSTGDAYFDKGVEVAVKQINLNITEKSSLIDSKKQQMVEALCKGATSLFRLEVSNDFYNKTSIRNLKHLFEIINDHTHNLICDEVDFWSNGEGREYNGKDTYLDQLNEILDKIKGCQDNECIIRIGQGSGWRFITGAWLESIDKDYFRNEIVPMCRPRNYNYSKYPFPKSRRIDSYSNVFGFVKLTII